MYEGDAYSRKFRYELPEMYSISKKQGSDLQSVDNTAGHFIFPISRVLKYFCFSSCFKSLELYSVPEEYLDTIFPSEERVSLHPESPPDKSPIDPSLSDLKITIFYVLDLRCGTR